MGTFRRHLEQHLADPEFRKLYDEEKRLVELSLKIHKARESLGWTQKEAADRAQITQQQLSKIENGINCNMITFLKACHALGLELDLDDQRRKRRVA